MSSAIAVTSVQSRRFVAGTSNTNSDCTEAGYADGFAQIACLRTTLIASGSANSALAVATPLDRIPVFLRDGDRLPIALADR
jgi:hypothetical protein